MEGVLAAEPAVRRADLGLADADEVWVMSLAVPFMALGIVNGDFPGSYECSASSLTISEDRAAPRPIPLHDALKNKLRFNLRISPKLDKIEILPIGDRSLFRKRSVGFPQLAEIVEENPKIPVSPSILRPFKNTREGNLNLSLERNPLQVSFSAFAGGSKIFGIGSEAKEIFATFRGSCRKLIQ